MSDKGTSRLIAEHLGSAFADLASAFADSDAAKTTLRRLGWLFDSVPKEYLALATQAATIASKVADSRGSAGDNDDLVGAIFQLLGPLQQALKGLPAPTGIDHKTFGAEMPERLISMLLADYLSAHVPTLYHALVQLGIIQIVYHPEVDAGDGTVLRPASIEQQILYDEIPQLLLDPAGIPKRAFGWGTPDFKFQRVAEPLSELLSAAGLVAFAEGVHPDFRDSLQGQGGPGQSITTYARVSFMDGLVGDLPVNLSVALLDSPIEPAHPLPGIAIVPLLPQLSDTIPIGANTSVTVKGGIDLQNTFGLFIRPNETPELRFPFVAGGGIPSAGVSAELDFAPPTPSVLIGQAGKTRLEAKGASLLVGISEDGGQIEAKAEASSSFAVVVSSKDGDGFIGKILEAVGAAGLTVPLTAGLRWSNRSGFGFIGTGGFALHLTPHKTIGPLTVNSLDIALHGGAQNEAAALVASVGAGISVALGPITAAVDNMGVNLQFRFVEGNAGRFDFSVGFKPPTGVGLAISGGPVSGGGFISFDPDAGRYAGILALQVYSIGVTAVGVIDTKFPDGHRGFSFVIIISAEFTPIQLGYGFTLLGVGGLIGINRDLNADGLRDVVARGAMGNVLFPHNPIRDAPSIIHDIEQLFPPAEGRYTFGPLGRIGWGTPTIVDARVGIVLVFPGPRLALLGAVSIVMPPGVPVPELRLVEIHLDVDGVLDFPRKQFALDAHLHDSQVRGYPISGDMAMRLDWGQNPNFAIALGGFHPHYTPPAGFPTLRRLTIDLGIHGNPSAMVKGYLAVTSNTAQIGAGLDVNAHAGGASLGGGLSFDALFVFSPFSFEADLEGGVHVDFHGVGFSMHFHGRITGPAPWHLHGDVCVSVLWWDACVGFDVTLGGESKPELPEVDIWTGSADVVGLESAVTAAGNWSGVMPPGGYQAVSIRKTDASAASRVDPLGVATFQQKVLPFGLVISKFAGRAKAASSVVTVTVSELEVDGQSVLARKQVVKDAFAPGQYQKLPDAQALSSPSFQKLEAGFSFSSDDLAAGTEVTNDVTFKTIVVGSPNPGSTFSVSEDQLLAMVGRSAGALGGVRTGNIDRYVDFAAQPAFPLGDEVYAIASKATLARYTGDGTPDAPYAVKADRLAALPADVRPTLQIVPIHELPI
jgi:hypothetical protein